MQACLPAGCFPGAAFLVSSFRSVVSQKLMLAVLCPSPRAKPVVMLTGIWGDVNHPLVTDRARSRHH